MQVLVTGATGFIASHLLPSLLAKGWSVRGAVRHKDRLKALPPGVEGIVAGELGPQADWSSAAKDINVVVHLAARVHVMHDRRLDEYESANVIGTRKLAETAAIIGVKRFLFVSSVKAMGEVSPGNAPWSEKDECHPEDSYGRSKLAAELALHEIAARTNMELVILRPPVVYGPGVTANMYSLLRLIDHGWPLPLGSVKNRRSFVYVENFADAIVRAIEHPNAAGQTFLVSDGQDLSTPELVRAIARAFGKDGHLLPVPPLLLRLAGQLLGRSDEVNRAVGSLVVDSSKIRRLLDWQPPFPMEDGLDKTARWYIAMKSRDQTSPQCHGPVSSMSTTARLGHYLHEPVFKRPFDLLLSGIGILLSAPLWLLIAGSIWLEDGRPVFFRQPRLGRDGRLFWTTKFRSMIRNPDSVEVQARQNDPRISRVGKVLRKTALDELPQLWNIFIGDMSFVGPRSQPEKEKVKIGDVEKELYIRDVPGYKLRQLVRPGLTGIAQIYAPRDVLHKNKFRYDSIYVKRVIQESRKGMLGDLYMFCLDLRLIVISILNTLTARWEV